MPPNFSPGAQVKQQSSMQATKDDNLNFHLLKQRCALWFYLMVLNAMTTQEYLFSAHPTDAQYVYMFIQASQLGYRLGHKTYQDLYHLLPDWGKKEVRKWCKPCSHCPLSTTRLAKTRASQRRLSAAA